MHDWEQFVRQRLAGMEIDEHEATQVVEELAGNLEENYQSLLREGLSDEDAARRVSNDVGNWQKLQRNIEQSRHKEFIMTKRVAQFWLPSFLTLLLAMVFLMLIQSFGPAPVIANVAPSKLHVTPVAVVYVSWLLTLPFIGALGAFLSLRAGGSVRAALWSVVFPVLPYLALFVVALPVTVILDDYVAHHITIPAFFVGLSAWVIFPAIALLTGGLPVSHFTSRINAHG
jgi:VIT1/CCC1 family predicted Fe2+/Mn2+ transporter